jgi:hypothetical protein
MTQSGIQLDFSKIQKNPMLLDQKIESVDFIQIENFLQKEDSVSIQNIAVNKYKIRIQLELQIDNEFRMIHFASKLILLKHLGFVKEHNIPESISDKTYIYAYIKNFTNKQDVIDIMNKLKNKFSNFRTSIEMKENALLIFIDNALATLYPYQNEIIQPKHRKVKEVVDALIEAFVQDRNYSECINTELVEVQWGIKTARQIAKIINNTPEIIYRILKDSRTKAELLKFIDMVPYSGPGRYVKSIEKGRAFRIKMENPYIVEKLRELGIPLNVIFPGG